MYEQTFDFRSVFTAFDQLVLGAGLTLQLTTEAVMLGMAVAIIGAWAKTNGPAWSKSAVGIYVEVIRNTPFLLQL